MNKIFFCITLFLSNSINIIRSNEFKNRTISFFNENKLSTIFHFFGLLGTVFLINKSHQLNKENKKLKEKILNSEEAKEILSKKANKEKINFNKEIALSEKKKNILEEAYKEKFMLKEIEWNSEKLSLINKIDLMKNQFYSNESIQKIKNLEDDKLHLQKKINLEIESNYKLCCFFKEQNNFIERIRLKELNLIEKLKEKELNIKYLVSSNKNSILKLHENYKKKLVQIEEKRMISEKNYLANIKDLEIKLEKML